MNTKNEEESYIISEGFSLEQIDLDSLTTEENPKQKEEEEDFKSVAEKIKTDIKKIMGGPDEDEIKARLHFEYYVDPIALSLIKINEIKKGNKTVYLYVEGRVQHSLQALKHCTSVMDLNNTKLIDMDFVGHNTKPFKRDFSSFSF